MNSTECGKVYNNYRNECKDVISWDEVSVMPKCSSDCKRWIDELDNNPIGKYLKCCKCTEQDENKRVECINERQKVGIVCDIDYNSIIHCQQNENLCGNNLEELLMEHNTSTVPLYFETKKSAIQGKQQQMINFVHCMLQHIDQSAQSTAFEILINECRKDKCCGKAFHDLRYDCGEVMFWKNDTNAPPVCSMNCMNALDNLYADPLGKRIVCDGICTRFSQINHNSLADLEAAEWCNRIVNNLENLCDLSHNFECRQIGVLKDG